MDDNLEIVIIMWIVIIFIGLITLLVYLDIQGDKELCNNICGKKGCENLGFEDDGWGRDEKCKCLTQRGDIEYYPAE